MASAVTVIFGANSTQFQAELARMQALTVASSRRMASAAASGHMVGTTGIVRETAVIGREIAQGRGIGRILASLTLLTQYLSSASRAAQQGASAARTLSDAYAEASFKANAAAVAAMRKASATATEAEMEGFEIDATLTAADADAEEAATANAAAAALARKAEAAAADAAAQEADAAATAGAGMSWILISGIFTAVALAVGVVYERIWGISNLIKSLGFDVSTIDLRDDYIPLLERHLSDVRNAQKEITDEVNKTVNAYYSAAEQAKRGATASKEHFEYLKKMLDIQKETELTTAKTPGQKEGIEARYAGKSLELQKMQQGTELANKLLEKHALESDSQNKFAQANAIKVTTKAEDQKSFGQLNQEAEAAEKFLKGDGVWGEVKKNFAIAAKGPLQGYAMYKMLQATEEGGAALAAKTIAKRDAFADEVKANDETRKAKEQLVKDAAKAAAAAAGIGASVPDIVKANAQKNAETSAEAAAKLAEGKARDLGKMEEKGYSLNSQQKIGAYAATAPVLLQIANHTRGILANTTPHGPPSNHPPGERKPQLGTRPSDGNTRGGNEIFHKFNI